MAHDIDEQDVRAFRESFREAVTARDVDRVMTFYAEGDAYQAFDMVPPLSYANDASWRRGWEDFFALFDDGPFVRIGDLRVTCSGNLAVTAAISHMAGSGPAGPIDMWTRSTSVLAKQPDGRLLMVHDHFSVPIDLESGRARTDLVP